MENEALVPNGFPRHMSYKPGPDTVEAHLQLQNLLAGLDRKLKTSNHLQAHQLTNDFLLPILLLLQQQQICGHRDLLRHTHDLAEHLVEGGIDPDALAEVLEPHLAAVEELIRLVAPLATETGVTDLVASGDNAIQAKQAKLADLCKSLETSMDALAGLLASDEEGEGEGEGEGKGEDAEFFEKEE